MTIQTSLSIAKSSVLIAGATGFIGQFLVTASLESGRSTYILVRSTPICPSKAKVLRSLEEKGAVVFHGLINDKEKLEKILKEHKIDIVISAVGGESILDQVHLLDAIKAVGTVKRFLPSEFGHDVDRADPVEPGLQMYLEKRKIRRMIEEYGVPYTYICCNSIASWPYHDNTHPSEVLPPLDQFRIYGDGTIKAYFVAGSDIGKFTMKIVDDVRTINKSVHFRPSCNFYNMNELAALWEKKIGRNLPRATMSENDLLSALQVNYSIDGINDVEVCSLYPEEGFRSLDDCFGDFVHRINEKNISRDENAAANHMVEPLILQQFVPNLMSSS